jgi:hypothetical protein
MKLLLLSILIVFLFSCSQVIEKEDTVLVTNSTDIFQNSYFNEKWVGFEPFESKNINYIGNFLKMEYHNSTVTLYYLEIEIFLNEKGYSVKTK